MMTLFSKDGCMYCDKAKDVLKKYPSLHVRVFNLNDQLSYETARERMVAHMRGGGGGEVPDRPTLPQIFVGSQWIPGGATNLLTLDRENTLMDVIQAVPEHDVPLKVHEDWILHASSSS